MLIQTTKKPYIIWVTGPALGSAKTWTLALLGYYLYRAGYTIITNFDVSYPHEDFWKYYYNIRELFKLGHVAVLLDDVNNIPGFESRRPSDPLNVLFSSFGQGCRKADRYLFFSCPRLLWGEIRQWDIASIHVYTDHMLVDGEEMVKWEVLDKRFDPPKRYTRWFNAAPVYPLYITEEMMPPAALTERPELSNVPARSREKLKEPALTCPRCNTSGGLNYSRRDGIQYCRKCGWEREIKKK